MDDKKVAYIALGVGLLGLFFPRPSGGGTVTVAGSSTAVGATPSPHRDISLPPTISQANANIILATMATYPPARDRTHRITFSSNLGIVALTKLFRVSFGASSGGLLPSLGYNIAPNVIIQDQSNATPGLQFFAVTDDTGPCSFYDVYAHTALGADGTFIINVTVAPNDESFD